MTIDRQAQAIAATLAACPYGDVRPAMVVIEGLYGGRAGVPAPLATYIGRQLRARRDYRELIGRNGT